MVTRRSFFARFLAGFAALPIIGKLVPATASLPLPPPIPLVMVDDVPKQGYRLYIDYLTGDIWELLGDPINNIWRGVGNVNVDTVGGNVPKVAVVWHGAPPVYSRDGRWVAYDPDWEWREVGSGRLFREVEC